MVRARVVRLLSRDVYTNLASEEVLFNARAPIAALFYVNRSCVVLGRTQNAFVEVDLAYTGANGVDIARRRSGGGCVVHDQGNLNFCFMSERRKFDKFHNAHIVADVLRDSFAVPATVNDRADIIADGCKLSGAAYRISKDRAYHHGTVLVRSDLDALRMALKSPLRDNIEAMGTKSVRSPVVNVAHYCPTVRVDDVIEAIAKRVGAAVDQVSSDDVQREYGGVEIERAVLDSHKWVYGQMPRFRYFIDASGVRFNIHLAKGGIIENVSAEGVAVDQTAVQHLHEALIGARFEGCAMAERLRILYGPHISELTAVLAQVPLQHWSTREATAQVCASS